MPTPTKPVKILEMEKRSHRTKKELAQRKRGEAELLTGMPLREKQEVKNNADAHREFLRLKRLLSSIGKNDDLYGETINRYCLLVAECMEFQEKREKIYEQLCSIQNVAETYAKNCDLINWKEAISLEVNMQKNLVSIDRQIQSKRKMLLDMEKENIMTIASSLRSVPKNPDKKRNPLMEALNGS